MTVKLVKQKQKTTNEEKQVAQPSTNQLIVTTQNWVAEFKARKAKGTPALNLLTRTS